MKITITINDYLVSELKRNGFNEFINDNHITAFNSNYSLIRKIMMFDDDVYNIVTEKLFNGMTLDDIDNDKRFKKMFVNRFLNRQIKFQTIETFSGVLTYEFLSITPYLNSAFSNINEYLTGKNISTSEANSIQNSNTRSAYQSLPQTEVNLNLNDETMNYADDNTVSKSNNNSNNNQKNETNIYDIENLNKILDIYDKVFNIIERKCFLHVW